MSDAYLIAQKPDRFLMFGRSRGRCCRYAMRTSASNGDAVGAGVYFAAVCLANARSAPAVSEA
jgi:hypothetical protein